MSDNINGDLQELKELLSIAIQQTDARTTNVTEKFHQLSTELEKKDRERWNWMWGIVGAITLVIMATWFSLWVSNRDSIHVLDKQMIVIQTTIEKIGEDLSKHLENYRKRSEPAGPEKRDPLW